MARPALFPEGSVRQQVRLPIWMFDRLDDLAHQEGVEIAKLVRRAITAAFFTSAEVESHRRAAVRR